AELFGPATAATHRAAAAVEMIHAYSLIHDDLPAMDNDDLRRGKPTCHIAFDEATAILAGDGLQALAFETLADQGEEHGDAPLTLRMVRELAAAAGPGGMVGGPAMDLAAVNRALDLPAPEARHNAKTGGLIPAGDQRGEVGGWPAGLGVRGSRRPGGGARRCSPDPADGPGTRLGGRTRRHGGRPGHGPGGGQPGPRSPRPRGHAQRQDRRVDHRQRSAR